jgi:hypothetical protein
MPSTRYAQQRTITAQITIGGKNYGQWDKTAGRGLTSEKVQHGEGPVGAGVRSRDDGTYSRAYGDQDAAIEKELEDKIGQPVTVVESMKGDDGLPLGGPRTYTGVLGTVNRPEGDTTASERGELEIVCFLNVNAS